ncbi:MAG TPA: energy transducer TonB, partial [Xanthomonadaceae bacterium]|nr:energy transducer TonB [Xanthomonadaceae bacterium]
LTKAKTAENEKRLYAPAGDNAIEYYLALRQRHPNDESAKSALLDLFPYAMIATEQNLKKGDEPGRIEAARIFALLERVDTNAPSLPRLRAMMQKEAGDELKQQQDAAKKAQEDLAKKTEADKAAAALKAQQQAAAQNPATPPQPVQRPAQAAPPPRPAQTQASAPAPAPSPTEAAPPPKPARVGLPDVVSSAQPVYPRDALRDGVSGEVTVAFTVNPDGSVSGASVVSSNPRRVFDAAALEAIRKWRFEAPGEAVSGKRTFAFNPGN